MHRGWTGANVRTLLFEDSAVHAVGKFKEHKDPEILKSINRQSVTLSETYQRSTLLDILFARENWRSVRRRKGSSFTNSNVLTLQREGFCTTGLNRHAKGGGVKLALGILRALAAKPTEAGARNLVWGATEDFESGRHIHTCKAQEALSKFDTSPDGVEAQRRVFEEVVAILRAEEFQF
ncbi:hypothetical protein BT69DRAFT_1295360 [Atractiella rhizophila]|nr:hypothetical protein BT69DRAFT_1295360 [Atractiella rhizophila]